MGVLEDLLGLQFNLHIGTMYVEHEVCGENGHISNTILVQKNMSEVGAMSILDLGSFKAVSISKS
jgi:hypothetical protein